MNFDSRETPPATALFSPTDPTSYNFSTSGNTFDTPRQRASLQSVLRQDRHGGAVADVRHSRRHRSGQRQSGRGRGQPGDGELQQHRPAHHRHAAERVAHHHQRCGHAAGFHLRLDRLDPVRLGLRRQHTVAERVRLGTAGGLQRLRRRHPGRPLHQRPEPQPRADRARRLPQPAGPASPWATTCGKRPPIPGSPSSARPTRARSACCSPRRWKIPTST